MINAAEPVDAVAIDSFIEVRKETEAVRSNLIEWLPPPPAFLAVQAFSPYGLRRDIIFPTYGLAEHSVFVCSGGHQRLRVNKVRLETAREVVLLPGTDTAKADGSEMRSEASEATLLVGCGYPFQGTGVELAIVNEDSGEQLGPCQLRSILFLKQLFSLVLLPCPLQ